MDSGSANRRQVPAVWCIAEAAGGEVGLTEGKGLYTKSLKNDVEPIHQMWFIF